MKVKYIATIISSILILGMSSCKKKEVDLDPLTSTKWFASAVTYDNHPEKNIYKTLIFYKNGEYIIETIEGLQKVPTGIYERGRYKFIGNKEKFQTYVIFIPNNIINPGQESKSYYHNGAIKYGNYTFYPQ